MSKFLAVALATTSLLCLAAALPAQARERSNTENRRCLAVGRTMSGLAKTEKDLVDILKGALTDSSTQEDRDTIAQLEQLSSSTASVGASLELIFSAAPKPDQVERDELNQMPVEKLIDEADKCVD